MLTHGELFAGIGGFSTGFDRANIQTEWAVEIDPQCRRVLAAHHPNASLFDDVRAVGAHNLMPVDIITFGSPCQDLSVAGKRKGFAGERSGLFTEAVRIIRELQPSIAVWENVVGALSSNQRRDFGAALAWLVGTDVATPAKGWGTAGVVYGPDGAAAWRVCNAQFFGVAQRRRRVFVVFSAGTDRAAEILLERDGVRRHSAPRGETSENTSADAADRAETHGRQAGTDGMIPIVEQAVANTLGGGTPGGGPKMDTDRVTFIPTYWDGGQTSDTLDVSMLVKGQMMPEKRRFPVVPEPTAYQCHGTNVGEMGTLRQGNGGVTGGIPFVTQHAPDVAPTLRSASNSPAAHNKQNGTDREAMVVEVAHTLRGEGFDASEDGTGRGTPLVVDEAPIAFSSKDSGNDAGSISPTLRSMNFDKSHMNGGGQVAVAYGISNQPTPKFAEELPPGLDAKASGGGRMESVAFALRGRDGESQAEPFGDLSPSLRTGDGGSSKAFVASAPAMAVRRLTPTECARLQGFPDDHLDIVPPLADSPKYRMLGNAVAVPVAAWLGQRIAYVLNAPTTH